jgi:hypothetical protein
VADPGFDLSTWVFLGTLAGATAAVLVFYSRAIHLWTPPAPRTDLVSPDHITRMRGVETEVDLGRGWRATDDPGAAWHLWWMPSSGDIIGLRTSELPPPPGPFYFGSVGTRSPLDAYGVHKFTGMKVLGNSGDRPAKALCDELRPRPDGLDLFTGGTHPAPDLDDEDLHDDSDGDERWDENDQALYDGWGDDDA